MRSLINFAHSAAYDYTPTQIDYHESGMPSASEADLIAGILLIMLVSFVFCLGYYIFHSIMLGKIFKKADIEPWRAWVPFYNFWIMFELGNQPGWLAILLAIPGVNVFAGVFLYIAMFYIGKKLGKEDAFVLIAIFASPVWLIWLAVDKSKWTGEKHRLAKHQTAEAA